VIAKPAETFGAPAKCARFAPLLQHNAVVFDGDLDEVSFTDVERLPQLRGQYDPSEVVDLSADAGRPVAQRTLRSSSPAAPDGAGLDYPS
jgi:hypothetical protein